MAGQLPLGSGGKMSSTGYRLFLLLVTVILLPIMAFSEGMTLTVESAKPRYLVDEPLLLTITLKNTSDKDVELPVILDPAVGLFGLFISEPGGKPQGYDCGMRADIDFPKHGKIFVPGETFSTRMWLASYVGYRPSILSKPGTYTFFARYNLRKELPGGAVALRSADIQVQVSQPVDEEKDAHDLLLDGTDGRPWGYPSTLAAMEALMNRYTGLVQQYPKSVYALYAQSQYAQDLAGYDLYKRDATRQEKITYATQSRDQYKIYMQMATGTQLEADGLLKYGRAQAIVGEVEPAALAFETALLSPTATTYERLQSLSWTRLTESGSFREHFKEDGEKYPIPERTFPLLESARVFGFTVAWDEQTQTAVIANPRISASLRAGSNKIVVNGKEYSGAQLLVNEEKQLRVSARTLGYLLQLDWLTRPVLP